MSDDDFYKMAEPLVSKKWALLFKDRISKFSDLEKETKFLARMENYPRDLLIWKNSSREDAKKHLEKVLEILEAGDKEKIMAYAEKEGKGEVLWPLRVALSGQKNSPGPFEILDCLEGEESVNRIRRAISKL